VTSKDKQRPGKSQNEKHEALNPPDGFLYFLSNFKHVQWRMIRISLCLLMAAPLLAQEAPTGELCQYWSDLYQKIQYGSVNRREAGQLLRKINRLLQYYVTVRQDSNFYFPLENYDTSSVGGSGSGYTEWQYNFLHGNAHRAHPAHDIFIHDTNQDGLDDATGQPVKVLAMTDGLVVAMKTDWTPADTLRGGNYLVLFNPTLQRLYYYAHNAKILVKLGEVIKAGSPIATVGRTGKNAYPQRSPTHLHLMILEITEDRNKPLNYYDELVKAKTSGHTFSMGANE